MRTIVPVPSWDDVDVPEDGDLVRRADLVAAYQALANRDECFANLDVAIYELRVSQSGVFSIAKTYDRRGNFTQSGTTITFPKSASWLLSVSMSGRVIGSTRPYLNLGGREIFGQNEESKISGANRVINLFGGRVAQGGSIHMSWDGPSSDPFSPDAKGELVVQEILPTL